MACPSNDIPATPDRPPTDRGSKMSAGSWQALGYIDAPREQSTGMLHFVL